MSTVCTIGDEVRVRDNFKWECTGIVEFIGQIKSSNGIHYGVRWQSGRHQVDKHQVDKFVQKEQIQEVLNKATTLRVTVGDVVWVDKKNCRAMIRFIGFAKFGPNPDSEIWYGLQLEKRKGKNDGSIKGKRYFHCLPKYGLFVKASQMRPEYHINGELYNPQKYDAQEIQTAMILQKWLRCCRGFAYDVGNKYHPISSIGIVKLIKSFAFQRYDTLCATTHLFFRLNELNPVDRLFGAFKGVSYEWTDDKKNWNVLELYVNDERECKYIQKGCIGTWKVLDEEKILWMKFTKCMNTGGTYTPEEMYLDYESLSKMHEESDHRDDIILKSTCKKTLVSTCLHFKHQRHCIILHPCTPMHLVFEMQTLVLIWRHGLN